MAAGPFASARDCDVCGVDTPAAEDFELSQPLSPSPQAFMAVALQARDFAVRTGNPPLGAALVLQELVAGAAPDRTVSGRDATAHAEIEAIRNACRRLGVARLDRAVLYASARPCRMCELACHYAGIARIVYGEALTDAGPPRYEGC
jgi:guanine deaminase